MDNKRKRNIIIVIAVLVLIAAFIGITYALATVTVRGEKNVTLNVKNMEFSLTEDSTSTITLQNAQPVSKWEGTQNPPYKFTLTNGGSRRTTFSINLDSDADALAACTNCSALTESFVDYQLSSDGEVLSTGSLTGSKSLLIDNLELLGGETKTYELVLWLDYYADNTASGKQYFGKLRIEGKEQLD